MATSFPQTLGNFSIPSSERGDSEPVRSSLELARADLERGQLREALRHLRRAAEDADEAGSEQRAVALARAAADLATEAGSSVAPPPAATPATLAPASLTRSSTEHAVQQLLDSGRAVKVVVKRSARDDGLYVVRRADAAGSPLGAREAVLVLLEQDDAFFEPPA